MTVISRRHFFAAALCLLLTAPWPALAADADGFDALVDEAQGGYRAALFYARTGNAALAGIELRQAQAVWDEITARYGAAPPATYAKDDRFAADLKAITGRISKGADLLDEEKGKEARRELAPVRDLIYGLRNRAGRKGYSECVTDLNRHMDVMFKWRHDRPDFAVAGTADAVMAAALKYRDILRACRAMAPAHYQKAADFKRIYDGADASISSMPAAVERKDALGVVNILRELRSFDRILFFKLG
ncbi:MAG: hypothetical protein CMM77_07565 [Rhodospirillaceae bacterium]|nr:hypothetical protein [Magnetovibrio sp.]MAY66970.1 hypothetical protein [Rhodospirillaceae bacterium]